MTLKAHGRTGHVEPPHAGAFDAHFFESLAEIVDPSSQGDRVVLAQAFEVAHFKAVRLEHRHQRADFVKFTVGKDVTIDELTARFRGTAKADRELHLTTELRGLGRSRVVFERDRTTNGVIKKAPTGF